MTERSLCFLGVRCAGDRPPDLLSGLVALTTLLVARVPLRFAVIDGFTDARALPADAADGLATLVRFAAARHARDLEASRWYRWLRRAGPTNMGIEVDLTDPGTSSVVAFAPYSIHATLRSERRDVEVTFHDSGVSGARVSMTSATVAADVRAFLDEAGAAYEVR